MSTSSNARVWSSYQDAVFNMMVNGTGNGVVEAVAGSGKTTTIVEGINRYLAARPTARCIFVAFNKAIALELERKVPAGCMASTLHSVCYKAVARGLGWKFGQNRVNDRKLHDACSVVSSGATGLSDGDRAVADDLGRMYPLMRATMTDLNDPRAVDQVVSDYGLTVSNPTASYPLLSKLDLRMVTDTSQITYDEMLTFVIDHNLALPKFDMVCVDEAQDMNRVQIEILRRMLSKNGGRLIAIGDSFQSIYAFRGADMEAMNRIRREFSVTAEASLPLSITYRCGSRIVDMAKVIVPHIEARPDAHLGTVEQRPADKLYASLDEMQPGDMGVCRVNAPLAGMALHLIRQGKKAVVRGRDIGKALIKLARDLVKRCEQDDMICLVDKITVWRENEVRKLVAQKKDAQAQQVEDRAETLLALMDGLTSIRLLEGRIEQVFSDDVVGIVFSSIHKAKGLEASNVVFYGPEMLPHPMAVRSGSKQAIQQEYNLKYVGVTRAIDRLVMQTLPPKNSNPVAKPPRQQAAVTAPAATPAARQRRTRVRAR